MVDVSIVIDCRPGRAPLAGMLTSFAQMQSRYVFAVVGDGPNPTARFASELAVQLVPGTQAIVLRNAHGRIEPLAALYDRLAFLRIGLSPLRCGNG